MYFCGWRIATDSRYCGRMATQSLALELDKSAQLEPSVSIAERAKALILDATYDAPAFKDVETFRGAFEEAEKGAHEVAGKLFRDLAELIKYCAMVRSYLSERGVNAHLRKAAGIPAGFERWYMAFQQQHDIAWAYKTMLHKIAELEGGCNHCGRVVENDAGHKKSCILYRPLIALAEPEEGGTSKPHLDTKETTNAYLADRALSMIGLLNNAPKDTSPQQIIETMRAEAQSAYEDLDAETAKRIKVPELVVAEEHRRLHYLASKVVRLLEIREVQAALKAVTIQSGTGCSHPGKTILSTALLLAKELPAKRRTDDAAQLQGSDAESWAQKEAL
jgi:hypothetical protein